MKTPSYFYYQMTLNVSNQYVPHVHPDLDVLSSWIDNWKVMFNETRCSLLLIVICMSAEQNDYQYLINNLPIPSNQQKKSWHDSLFRPILATPYIWVTSKAYKFLGLLCRTFCSSNNITTKKQLYIFHLRSQLLFSLKFGDQSSPKTSTQLNHFNFMPPNTYWMTTTPTNDPEWSRLIKLYLLPFTMLLELNDICFFAKSLKLNSSNNSSKYISFSH